MVHFIGRTALTPLQSLLQGFMQDGSVPFSSVLTLQDIVDLISQTCVETYDRIFTPVVTLCTFLRQIHSDDPSCRAAVARLNATRAAQGLAPSSPLTGGYCKARQRLPETLLHRLVPLSGQRLQQQVPTAWHWHGRAVKIVDGSGVSMPDTEANQQDSPQPGSQAWASLSPASLWCCRWPVGQSWQRRWGVSRASRPVNSCSFILRIDILQP